MALLNTVATAQIVLIAALAAMVPGAAPGYADGFPQGQTADEYQVKAAYMYNFAKFVDWPAQAFDSSTQPIVFCVLGQTPLGPALRDTLAGKVVDQRPLVFRQITDPKDASKCQVLFIDSDKKHLRLALDEVKSLNVLTVGESEDFTSQGGVVRFVLDGGECGWNSIWMRPRAPSCM